MSLQLIFSSTREDGPMTNQQRFYQDGMSKEDILKDVLRRRMILGKKYGFDGRKIIVPLQKNATCEDMYQDGKYVVLNDQDVVYQDVDLWDIDIPTDIMLIKKGLTGVMMAYPAADCPVIIMRDKKNEILALAHASAWHINRLLPMQIADSLLLEANSSDNDIEVYVGPFADSSTYTYKDYPKWATNDELWRECIYLKDGLYHIDLRKALMIQFLKRNISLENITMSKVDTITNPLYYSNHSKYVGEEKEGRFLVGTGYVKTLKKTLKR